MPEFDIIILAAGQGSRMGKIKQLLPYNDSTLIEITVQKSLQLGARAIVTVLGAHAEHILPSIKKYPVDQIINPNWKTGMASSIVAGVLHLEKQYSFSDGVLILLCDQPLLVFDDHYLIDLIKLWQNSPLKLVASKYERNYGVPCLYPVSSFKELKKLGGDQGGKALINSGAYDVIGLEVGDLGKDIDSNTDYNELIAKF